MVGTLALGVTLTDQSLAQEPPIKPPEPTAPADPSKKEKPGPKSYFRLELLQRNLERELLRKPNTMPGAENPNFSVTEEQLLMLVTEVIVLQDRVKKLEQQLKK
jgi:hypothetical protein